MAGCWAIFRTVSGDVMVWIRCRRSAGHVLAGDPTHQGKLGRHLVRWR